MFAKLCDLFDILGVFTFVAIGILAIFFLGSLIVKNKKISIPIAIISLLLLLAFYFKGDYIQYKLRAFCGFSNTNTTKVLPIYDTDPRNNSFIKGSLNERELLLLDRVLMVEKRTDGMALDRSTLIRVSRNYPKVIEAYDRWRKCKTMRRSDNHVIYPDERRY